MKQIVQSAKSGNLALRDVPLQKVKRGSLLVETRASLISAGTERSVTQFAKSSMLEKAKARPDLVKKVLEKAKRDGVLSTFDAVMARLDEPMPLGYSAAGVVVAVGKGLEGKYSVGQRVAIAGAGLANHAEFNVVPENLVAPIPDEVRDEEAAFCTMGSIALHAVRNMKAQLGDQVAVIGAGLVGQLAGQFLALAGARVAVFDYDDGRLALARQLCAEVSFNPGKGPVEEEILSWTGGKGCDSVLVAAATKSSEPLAMAAQIARDRARISMVGVTGTEFSYRDFMQKELSLVVSRSYGPGRYDTDYEDHGIKYPIGFVRWTENANLAESVRLMDPRNRQRLDVQALITHRFDLDDAESAYRMILSGSEPHLGVMLRYPEEKASADASLDVKPVPTAAGSCRLGVVGAGPFMRTILLPRLQQVKGCRLSTLVTSRGMTAQHFGETYDFERQTTELDEVLQDPGIDAIVAATPHSSHANLVISALRANKHIFIEKPLALSREELSEIRDARAGSKGFFTVGFNRRFAPMVTKAKAVLKGVTDPKVLLFRVNAGAMPDNAPMNQDSEGGGRILGECCHFIDLARYLAGSPIIQVNAQAVQVKHGVCDDLTITLRFQDGSLATIVYTAKGDSAFSKERFEVFAGGRVLAIDNFLRFSETVGGRSREEKALLRQDKGHGRELEAFVQAVKAGVAPIEEQELLETSLATLCVLESLGSGQSIQI